jgi:hypothetical protein
VLEGLVAENDSVPEAWQLLGLAYYSGGALDEADEAAGRCAELLAKRRAAREAEARQRQQRRRRGQQQQGEAGDDGEEGGCGGVEAALADLQAAIAEARGGGDGKGA